MFAHAEEMAPRPGCRLDFNELFWTLVRPFVGVEVALVNKQDCEITLSFFISNVGRCSSIPGCHVSVV